VGIFRVVVGRCGTGNDHRVSPQIQNSTENERTGPLPIKVQLFIRKMCLNYLDTA
jgi:hypothetical protein